MGDTRKTFYHYSMNGLFMLFLFLLPFQNSGLSETALNYIGLYLSNIPLSIMLLFSIGYTIYRKYIKCYKLFIMISLFAYVFFYSLLVCLWVNEDITVSVYKTITGCINLLLQVYVFYICRNRLLLIKKYVWIAFFIDILGWVLCDVYKFDMGWLIHQSLGDGRFRGFAAETSWFSFTTMVLGLLSIAASSKKKVKIFYATLMISIVLFGGSKGTALCLLVAVTIGALLTKKVNLLFKPLLIAFTGLVGYEIFQNFILEAFVNDLSDATSFTTRVSSIVASFMIFVDYPLGTGYGAFQSILRVYYVDAFNLLNTYIPIFNLSSQEIFAMLNDTSGVGLSVKGIFFQYIAYFGLPFLLIVALGIYQARKWKLSNYWKISTIFVVICLLCFANFYYDSILFFAVLVGIAGDNKLRSISDEDVTP